MGLFDKFKRRIPPVVQIFYNQDFGFLIVPNAVEKTMGCHISIEPTEYSVAAKPSVRKNGNHLSG